MAQPSKKLIEDVELLLEQVVLEEATAAVWSAFEKVLNDADPDSLQMLRKHFDGVPIAQIAEEKHLSLEQAQSWIEQTKSGLIEKIRRDLKVRQ